MNDLSALTLQVPRGTKVNVQEVDVAKDADPRIPADRNVILSAGKDMKIAIKQVDTADLKAKASVVLMCG
jgi:hypothetical protein